MKYLLTFVIAFYCTRSLSQNLVPNYSFEEHDLCPWSLGVFNQCVVSWFNPTSSTPDYYNACDNVTSTQYFGVPGNNYGYQPARTGVAYAAIGLFGDSSSQFINNPREYIEVRFSSLMEQDSLYCVKFYLSLTEVQDFCAVANVGAYLSSDSVYGATYNCLPYTPQIVSDSNVLLQDTMNWMEISGTYQSNGTEQFITIGNFLPNNQTNTFRPNPFGDNFAYYYVDDVSVIKCSQVTSANDLVGKSWFNIYPNPGNDLVEITSKENLSSIVVTDAVGRIIHQVVSPNNHVRLVTKDWSAGLYFIQVNSRSHQPVTKKLIVQH